MTAQYHFFCDESGITQDRFLVIGGIAINALELQKINRDIDEYRRLYNMHAELKWEKISSQKESEYKSIINYFFEINRIGRAHFHSLIVPYSRFDHKCINLNDKMLSLHKMFYQLILHRFCRLYGRNGNELFIHPDLSTKPLCGDVCRMLNRAVRSYYAIAKNPVKAVEPRDSAACNFLQLNDVILGAISAQRNQRHLRVGSREAKRRLAEYVLQQSGLPSYENDTPLVTPSGFTVWNLRSPLLRSDRAPRGSK